MKLALLYVPFLALACLAFAPLMSSSCAARVPDALGDPTELARQRAALEEAVSVLNAWGLADEARRLRDASPRANLDDQRARIEARAELLLDADLDDFRVRESVLYLAIEGYMLTGRLEDAHSLIWFARGPDGNMAATWLARGPHGYVLAVPWRDPMPFPPRPPAGQFMQLWFNELVLGAPLALERAGAPKAALAVYRLARFYARRY